MNRFRARNRWMPGVVLTLMLAVFGGQVAAVEHLHVDADLPTDCLVCPHGDSTPAGATATAAGHSAHFSAPVFVGTTDRDIAILAATRPPVRGPPAHLPTTLR